MNSIVNTNDTIEFNLRLFNLAFVRVKASAQYFFIFPAYHGDDQQDQVVRKPRLTVTQDVCAIVAARLLNSLFTFVLFIDLCCFLLPNGLEFKEANGVHQRNVWSWSDLYHFQRNSGRFCHTILRPTIKHVEIHSNHRRNLPVLKTTKRGSTVLILPNRLFQTDLTIHMDVKANPGPEIHRNRNVSAQSTVLHNSSKNYSRNQLLNMKAKYPISNDLYLTLKDNGILY